jgi:CBS domain containing-hemolysin-like protein
LDPDSWLLVGLFALGATTVGLIAAAETAFASVNRTLVRELAAAGRVQAGVAEELLGAPARLLSTFMVTRLSGAVVVVGALVLLARGLGGAGWGVWAVVIALVVVLLAHTLPRAWTFGRQIQIVLGLAPFVRLLVLGLTPVTAFLRRLNQDAAHDGAAAATIFLSDDGLRFLLDVTEKQTTIEDGEKEMIASIFAFSDKLVREVMVPRIDVAAVPVDVPMADALSVIFKDGHSRIPVYRDSIDNIVGILNAKDLLRYLRDGRTDVPLARILRTAYFIPESKKVDELLQELQQRRVHMAVVVDEYGGTAGIVTIEDLLEEIVGEIQDEYDAEEPTVEAITEDEYLFDARVPLDEARKRLGVELPEEGGDTLGGFIYSQLGRVPAVADRIEYGDTVFEVLSVAGRRIKQVRVSRHVTELAGQGENEATNERGGESANQRINESTNQRINESARQSALARV